MYLGDYRVWIHVSFDGDPETNHGQMSLILTDTTEETLSWYSVVCNGGELSASMLDDFGSPMGYKKEFADMAERLGFDYLYDDGAENESGDRE
jgi:hypothetical protein